MWWWWLCSGQGLIGCRSWTRTPIRPASRPGHRPGWRRWWPSSRAWPPRTPTGWPTAPGPSGPWCCGGWPTAWKATGWPNSPGWMPGGPPAPNRGCQAGSTAGWLRRRLHMSAGTAASMVRTARALYRGPLTRTGQALAEGSHLRGPCPGAGRRHPGPPRPHHHRGRTGAGGGGAAAGPAPAAAGGRASAAGGRPRRRRRTRPSGASSSGGCGCRPPGRAWSR